MTSQNTPTTKNLYPNGSTIHYYIHFPKPLHLLHCKQYRPNQNIKQQKTRLDKKVSQDYTRDWNDSRYSTLITEYYQTSRSCKYSIGRNWNNNITSKQGI